LICITGVKKLHEIGFWQNNLSVLDFTALTFVLNVQMRTKIKE